MSKKESNESNWRSFSDVMTGLMVIFMFIAISYILEAQKRENEVNDIIEQYKITQQQIYNDLDSKFTDRFSDYNLVVNPDLSIQITDANALFPVQFYDQEVYLTDKFESFLNEFTPLFYQIILKPEYRKDISEIRIEGHTSIQTPKHEFNTDYYQKMLVLSQKRSNKVLEYMMDRPYYAQLDALEKAFLRFITTSNGLAFGKALDSQGKFKYVSGNALSTKNSMRVEFRIVTNNQKVMDEWILKTQN
jgi:outer membrane protein OmpA-like peptidoglycan-associated protein